MPRPPRTRAAIAELGGESERHDWSIEELGEELAKGGLEADFSTVFRAVEALVEAGKFRAVIDRHYTFEDVVEATKYVETQQKVGNVVLTVA